MVSATTTIEAGFGSRVMTGGFLLNNELADFALEPAAAAAAAAALKVLGHEVVIQNLNSGLHVIQIGPEGLTKAADKRREGTVLGD